MNKHQYIFGERLDTGEMQYWKTTLQRQSISFRILEVIETSKIRRKTKHNVSFTIETNKPRSEILGFDRVSTPILSNRDYEPSDTVSVQDLVKENERLDPIAAGRQLPTLQNYSLKRRKKRL